MAGGPPTRLLRFLHRMVNRWSEDHRDLVAGMLAELHAIEEPQERSRFAWGAITAMIRLSLAGWVRAFLMAPRRVRARGIATLTGGSPMRTITTHQLLWRIAGPFAFSLLFFSGLLMLGPASRLLSAIQSEGIRAGPWLELLLSVPHTLALTVPLAAFVGVAWVFSRLGRDGTLQRVGEEPNGLQGLVTPVLLAASVGALLALVGIPRSFRAPMNASPRSCWATRSVRATET